MLVQPALRLILASAAIGGILAAASAQAPSPPSNQSVSSSVIAEIIPPNWTNNHVAAVVNTEKILVGEVRKLLDERPYPYKLTEKQKEQLRQAALEVLIEDVIMRQFLAKQVPQVTQEDFNREWHDFVKALEKMKTTVEEEMKKSGQTQDQLRNDIVAKLRWKTLLKRYYPDEKLKPYYDANKPFFDKVYVQASHILLKLPLKATKEQTDQTRQQMLIWRQEIITGKSKFEDIAKKYSHCPSKEKGGDIGKFPYKFVVVPEFARTAFSMKKGEISDVVQTVFGMHLIMVTDITPPQLSYFATLHDTIREVMAQDDELYPRLLSEQRKASTVKIELP